MKEEPYEEKLRSFTSWKLDIMDAITSDPNVCHIDSRVAFRILQHVRAKTRSANPSVTRIAAQIGVSPLTVKRSLKRLCDPDGACHWLDRHRKTRVTTYSYRVCEDRLRDVLDAKTYREERARDEAIEKRERQNEVSDMTPREVSTDACYEVSNDDVCEVSAVIPEHLRDNYLNRTPADFASSEEVREDTYTRERRNMFEPYPEPGSAQAGIAFLTEKGVPQNRRDECLELLIGGNLTPYDLEGVLEEERNAA